MKGSQGTTARWLVAATVGGAACVVGDHLHVARGVLFYPHPVFWDQAWWVFPLFFAATFGVVGGVRLIHPEPAATHDNPVRAAVGDFVAFLAAYGFTAFAHTLPDVVLGVLLAFWVARVIRGMPARHVLFCVVVAACGSGWEAMWSAIGMFTYRDPDFLGIPRWLPALYLHAAVAGDSARRVVDGK